MQAGTADQGLGRQFHLRQAARGDATPVKCMAGQFEEGQASELAGAVGQLRPAGVVTVQQGLRHSLAIGGVGRPGAAGGGGHRFRSPGGRCICFGQLVEDRGASGVERQAAADQIGGEARAQRVAFAERQHLGRGAVRLRADGVGGRTGRGGVMGAARVSTVASVSGIWVSGMVVLVWFGERAGASARVRRQGSEFQSG